MPPLPCRPWCGRQLRSVSSQGGGNELDYRSNRTDRTEDGQRLSSVRLSLDTPVNFLIVSLPFMYEYRALSVPDILFSEVSMKFGDCSLIYFRDTSRTECLALCVSQGDDELILIALSSILRSSWIKYENEKANCIVSYLPKCYLRLSVPSSRYYGNASF